LIKAGDLKASRLACDLAAILGERDLLRAPPGARDVDLRLRVAALRGEGSLPPGLSVDTRVLRQVARSSALFARSIRSAAKDEVDPHDGTGLLAALAYPDRIARARDGSGRYLLANGRGARFSEPQALAKSELIVAAELDGGEREARIFRAAPLRLEDLERHFAAHIAEHAEVVWDEREEAVRARRERRLGALVLDSSEIRDPDPGSIERAVLTGLKRLGLAALPWSDSLRQWQARVRLMREKKLPAAEPWPDLSDAALEATLEDWAPPWIQGLSRREHFARLDLSSALRSRLSYAQGAMLEREAPTHYLVPSGSRIPIDYAGGESPAISVRLQEMFGLSETPTVAGGRVALLLKLLSPAGRPVQVTSDLKSFWNRGYHEVKKDLKGRYPKHYWPDDPHSAQPTRRVRPR
jgi:ATP-dependent helicase HrpB